MNNVILVIDPHGTCGGDGTTIKIHINQNGQNCTTKPILYPTGSTINWGTKEELKDCASNKKFDPKMQNMSVEVTPTDNEEDYCINGVVVVLDDKKKTTYTKIIDNNWRKGNIDIDLKY